jgi:alanine racemase
VKQALERRGHGLWQYSVTEFAEALGLRTSAINEAAILFQKQIQHRQKFIHLAWMAHAAT